MGRSVAGAMGVASVIAVAVGSLVSHAYAFAPCVTPTAAVSASFCGSPIASTAPQHLARSRRACPATKTVMKVAATQPQQDSWQDGGLKTREIFNALSQGEIGKRAFTQALAKRMVAKATGMQQAYELQSEAAAVAAASSAAVEDGGDLR